MITDIEEYLKFVSLTSHIMDRSLSPNTKQEFIDEHKNTLEKAKHGLDNSIENFNTFNMDGKILDPDSKFTEYFNIIRSNICSAAAYLEFIINNTNPEHLTGFREDKWGSHLFLPVITSIDEIISNEIKFISNKINEISLNLQNLIEKKAKSNHNFNICDKKELYFEFLIIQYQIQGLLKDYLPSLDQKRYENQFQDWVDSLRKNQKLIVTNLNSLQISKDNNANGNSNEPSNPYFALVSAIEKYAAELDRLKLVEEFKNEENVRIYQNDLDSLNKRMTKLRLNMQKLELAQAETDEFCTRLNNLQEQVADLMRAAGKSIIIL